MNTKVTKLSKISNILFLSISFFFLSFLWINYYIKSLKKSFIYSLISSLIFFVIILFFNFKKDKKSIDISNKSKHKDYIKIQLLYSNSDKIMKFLIKLYNLENYTLISNNHLYSKNNNSDKFIVFKTEAINQSELENIYKESISQNIEIYCFDDPKNIIELENYNIKFITFNEIYKDCEENNHFPDFSINIKKSTKYRLKDILCVVFCKAKSKSYLWIGILLMFSSLFTPYNIYYIIMSTLLLLMAIYSRFNKRYN